jgi:hypothetical protein
LHSGGKVKVEKDRIHVKRPHAVDVWCESFLLIIVVQGNIKHLHRPFVLVNAKGPKHDQRYLKRKFPPRFQCV